MLRCRNKREKVEKCGRVPVLPQPKRTKISSEATYRRSSLYNAKKPQTIK